MLRNDLKFIGIAEENVASPRISVRWTCPKCGGHDLDLESGDVLGCQRVKGVDEEGNLVFDRPTFYTEESHFYLSCPDCAYEHSVDLDDREPERNIIKWLNDNYRESHSKDNIEDGDS